MAARKERILIEKKYEVIRFVKHQNRCHPAMDCIAGRLLIYQVQQHPEMEKGVVLSWIQKLAEQLELYHQCKNDQPYRYLNPYSVLVTGDDDIVLLDLEAKSNEFVLRNMQTQAMRNHFVRPIVHIKESNKQFLDLYSYGKTVQFILANVKTRPAFTNGEERRLARTVEKCLCESPKKRFEEFGQIKGELPAIKASDGGALRRRAGYAVAAALVLAVCAAQGIQMKNAEDSKKEIASRLEAQSGENEKLLEENGQLLEENQHLLAENQSYQAERQTMQEENQKLLEEANALREEAQSLQEENQRLKEGQEDSQAAEGEAGDEQMQAVEGEIGDEQMQAVEGETGDEQMQVEE